MICPRCNKPTLEEKDRDGITMDVCQLCRGIWLDRGELERLIAMADQEMGGLSNPSVRDREYSSPPDHHKEHARTRKHGHEGDHHYHHRKRSWLSEIFD